MIEALKKLRQYLLTGVSYAIPFIACGGILIAFSIAFAPMTGKGPSFDHAPTLKLINKVGAASFSLLLPILAGYISYAIAGKPGLVPGFIGGFFAGHLDKFTADNTEMSAGFLGALLAGLLAGWIVQGIKAVPVHKYIKPIMPILILPLISSMIISVIMLKVVGVPIAHLMTFLAQWLDTMNKGNAVILGMILGGMIAFDMGGPVNKAAFFFGAGLIEKGNPLVMGACAAAICTPPLGLGLATFLHRKLWSEEEREAGGAALAMGMIGITEGAIPFAAADPLRVIPCIMAGSMVASVIAMRLKVGDHAPHGGPIVLLVVDHRIAYVIAMVAGSIVTALAINTVKIITTRKQRQAEPSTAAAA